MFGSSEQAEKVFAGVLGLAVTVGAATLSMVSFSVSRQENLSNRIRLLMREYRDKDLIGSRKDNIEQQVIRFEARLQRCVCAHICLYIALTNEVAVSWLALLSSLLFLASQGNPLGVLVAVVAAYFLSVAFFFVMKSLRLHIEEYCDSNATMCIELEEIHGVKRKQECIKPPTWHAPIGDKHILRVATINFPFLGFAGLNPKPKVLTDNTPSLKAEKKFTV